MRVAPITPAIGATVEGVSLSDAGLKRGQQSTIATDLLELLYQHQVLVLPDQRLSPPELQRFAEQIGTPVTHPAYQSAADAPAVQVLESSAEAPNKIEVWHSDMSFSPHPPPITLLHAQIVPATGGDTLWSSAAAAFDGLSSAFQGLAVGLTALHDFRQGFAESLAEPGGEARLAAAVAANPPVSHPLVTEHPHSGRRAIYANPLFTSRIEQMGAIESEHLLAFFCREVVREEYQMRLRWRPEMLVLWDNRVTQHRPVNDFFPAHRKHHRVTIAQ